jgi:hypothetical protein
MNVRRRQSGLSNIKVDLYEVLCKDVKWVLLRRNKAL